MSPRAHKLKYTPDNSYCIIAISYPDNDIALSWLLNTQLDLNLKRIDDFEFIDTKGITSQFSLFLYEDDIERIEYCLISNHYAGKSLIKQYSSIDYFLKVSGEFLKHFEENFVKRVSAIADIVYATKLDNNTLAPKNQKIFDSILIH